MHACTKFLFAHSHLQLLHWNAFLSTCSFSLAFEVAKLKDSEGKVPGGLRGKVTELQQEVRRMPVLA
jgi:hypothetical protein